MTGKARTRITIDRLVLQGLAPAEAAKVRHALAAELSTRLSDGALATSDRGDIGHARLSVAPTTAGAELGRAAGRALAGRLGGRPQGRR
jgi:hypothetical protein